MAERLKAHAWKACVRASVPWVRIPLSPPIRPRVTFSVAVHAAKNPRFPAISWTNLLTGHAPESADFSLRGAILSGPLDWADLVRFSYTIDITIISGLVAPYYFAMTIGRPGGTEIEFER